MYSKVGMSNLESREFRNIFVYESLRIWGFTCLSHWQILRTQLKSICQAYQIITDLRDFIAVQVRYAHVCPGNRLKVENASQVKVSGWRGIISIFCPPCVFYTYTHPSVLIYIHNTQPWFLSQPELFLKYSPPFVLLSLHCAILYISYLLCFSGIILQRGRSPYSSLDSLKPHIRICYPLTFIDFIYFSTCLCFLLVRYDIIIS